MSDSIGYKTSFWNLVKNGITIPTLQRDYIYGAGTEKTETVLNNMLDTFKKAIETGHEETLDFVYGSESKAHEFMPLDGQQRLTTLYLLHYYAALTAKHQEGKAEDIFAILGKFSYATRNSTITFCNKALIARHRELANVVSEHSDGQENAISEYLKDLDDFRGAFYTDPSVMSMLVVLDRIHQKFHGMDCLWERLVATDCPIDFYILDFGMFDLSDDLYNKMNSRGKPLTGFEIIKAKMHRQIKTLDPQKASRIATRLDTDWMQYIWETLDRTKELKMVDPAYICFLKNLFRFFDYVAGCHRQQHTKLDDCCLSANTSSPSRVLAMERVFDTFAAKADKIPNDIKNDYNVFVKDCVRADMYNNRMLLLYAMFLGLEYRLSDDEFVYRYRHTRNIINNSSDFIREDFMHSLIIDVTHIMQGKLLKIKTPLRLNANSWNEEQEKEQHREIWKQLFCYEDINEINGTLNAFAIGLNDNGMLDLGDSDFVVKLKLRLDKAAHFFKDSTLEEYDRRSALLALGNYASAKYGVPQYMYFGIIKGSWLNFTGYHRYDERQNFMSAIDMIDLSRPISSYIGDTSRSCAENWRYYAIKYARDITVAYRKHDYGYMYFFEIDSEHPYNDRNGYLDVAILKSSYYSPTNVAWKMLHRLLDLKCGEKYNFFLDYHGADAILLTKIGQSARLEMKSNGWHLVGIDAKVIDKSGIRYIEENDDSHLPNCLIWHEVGKDYVEEGEEILEKLATLYPPLAK